MSVMQECIRHTAFFVTNPVRFYQLMLIFVQNFKHKLIIMKRTLLSLATASLLLACVSCANKSGVTENGEIALIPVPQEMTVGSDCFTLTRNAAITLDQSNEELKGIADYLNGFTLPVEKHGKIEFKLVDDAALGDEGYHLKVKQGDILLTANKPAGIFYGVQTLLQMLPAEIKSGTAQPKDKK